ncbi:hypothetical protein FBU30_009480 [Linnemannia zychae]|nr:hypothetical protein FBU30_009480 [Linnemannia zychae]
MAQNPIISTAAPASARTRTKWYLLGGTISPVDGAPSSSQFISIDLSVPWNTSSPAWTRLTENGTPAQALFPAVFSADESLMYVYHLPGDARVAQYNVLKNEWEPSGASFTYNGNPGVNVVTDPTTGYIYITGGYSDGSLNNVDVYHPSRPGNVTQIPFPVTGFVARWYLGNVYCKTRKSILYFGGYTLKTELISEANVVTQLDLTSKQFSTLNARPVPGGSAPAIRADHCLAISEDGSKLVVYGGRTSFTNPGLTGDLYILDTNTLEWTQGATGEARSYTACTIAGNQLIVWGGKTASPAQGAPEPITTQALLIYDMNRNQWVTNYTPPPPTSTTSTGSKPTTTDSGTTTTPEKSTNMGAIIGGVVGGLVVVCVAGFLFWRRRKQNGAKKQHVQSDVKLVKANASKNQSNDQQRRNENHRRDGQVSLQASGVGAHTGTKAKGDGTSVIENANIPVSTNGAQVATVVDEELEWKLKDLENQQKQIELKRQLLMLEQQGQQLRGVSGSPSGAGELTSQQQTFPINRVSQQHPQLILPEYQFQMPQQQKDDGYLFGMGGQPEPHKPDGYQNQFGVTTSKPTPTVHTIPESYVAQHPQFQQQDHNVFPNNNLNQSSQMYQDSSEPTYGPNPVSVAGQYPSFEYVDGTTHNGVGWIRQANSPHTVVERDPSNNN